MIFINCEFRKININYKHFQVTAKAYIYYKPIVIDLLSLICKIKLKVLNNFILIQGRYLFSFSEKISIK